MQLAVPFCWMMTQGTHVLTCRIHNFCFFMSVSFCVRLFNVPQPSLDHLEMKQRSEAAFKVNSRV